jgi:hypothetical protein
MHNLGSYLSSGQNVMSLGSMVWMICIRQLTHHLWSPGDLTTLESPNKLSLISCSRSAGAGVPLLAGRGTTAAGVKLSASRLLACTRVHLGSTCSTRSLHPHTGRHTSRVTLSGAVTRHPSSSHELGPLLRSVEKLVWTRRGN